jgi:hypothetical protein
MMRYIKISFVIVATTISTVAAQTCDYYQGTPCVKAQVNVKATVPFAPLFSQSPTFVYAIGDLDAGDIRTVQEKNGAPPGTKIPAIESNRRPVEPFPGNASRTHGTQFALRTFEEQKSKAAVGMTINYPYLIRLELITQPEMLPLN